MTEETQDQELGNNVGAFLLGLGVIAVVFCLLFFVAALKGLGYPHGPSDSPSTGTPSPVISRWRLD